MQGEKVGKGEKFGSNLGTGQGIIAWLWVIPGVVGDLGDTARLRGELLELRGRPIPDPALVR